MALEETEISERFVVSLDSYQGPFDALLSMLAQRKMELSQISLALITEDFLRYVSTLDMIEDADQISSFIDVASVLVEAKSASLLPHEEAQEPLEQSLEALRERTSASGWRRIRDPSPIRDTWMGPLRPCCRNWPGRSGRRTWHGSRRPPSPTPLSARCGWTSFTSPWSVCARRRRSSGNGCRRPGRRRT